MHIKEKWLTVFVTNPELPLESVRWGTVKLPVHAVQAYHRIDIAVAPETVEMRVLARQDICA